MTDALAPLVDELVRRSAAEVARIEGDAAARCRDIGTAAAEEARRREAEARAEGRRQADRAADRELLSARRRATELLAGQRSRALQDLEDACLDAAAAFHRSDRYPAFEERLVGAAVEALGRDARIERDPGGVGGVVATAGSRRLDLTLPALVHAAVGGLGPEVEELWR